MDKQNQKSYMRQVYKELNNIDKQYGFNSSLRERRNIILKVLDPKYIPFEESIEPKKAFIIKQLIPEMSLSEAISIADKVLDPNYHPFSN